MTRRGQPSLQRDGLGCVGSPANQGKQKMKLSKATTGDIVLSLLVPGWGLLVGLIALVKGELKRAGTMMAISAALIALLIGIGFYQRPSSSNAPPLSAHTYEAYMLPAMAEQLNQSAPRNVDAETRFDQAVAGPGRSFTYRFTLLNVPSKNIAPGKFDETIVSAILKSDCALPNVKEFFSHNIDVKYEYRGNDGPLIWTVLMTPALCAGK